MKLPKLHDLSNKVRSLKGRKEIKALSWIVIIVLVLGVLVGIPYLLSGQSSFYSNYDDTRARYQAWKKSTHAEVNCVQCHTEPKASDWLPFRINMIKEFYLKITLRPKRLSVFNKPGNKACLVCHSNTRKASPSGDLKIPHKAHVVILKMDCVSCHEFVVHKRNPEGKHTPRMAYCLTCHNGKKAVNRCDACHTKKSIPTNHRQDNWLLVHGDKSQEIDCKKCHGWVKDYCNDCHSRKPSSHAGLWRTNHRYRIEVRKNCKTCHQDTFCVKCHGEVPPGLS